MAKTSNNKACIHLIVEYRNHDFSLVLLQLVQNMKCARDSGLTNTPMSLPDKFNLV